MTDTDKQQINSLTMQGIPTAEIAKQLFYDRGTVFYWQRKMGLMKPKDYCDGGIASEN